MYFIFRLKAIRYLLAGGTGLFVNLGTLYLLVSICKMWYLLAAIIAFVVSSSVSFIMQKILTFNDRSTHRVHLQIGIFFGIALGNLAINTGLMYAGVSVLGLQYLVSQFLVSALIAVYSFLLYKHFVFKHTSALVGLSGDDTI